MIEELNEEINKFLSSLSNIEKNALDEIKKRYSSGVTDDLSKGHLTTNVCMIAASELKRNPKELANELQKELSDSNKKLFEELDKTDVKYRVEKKDVFDRKLDEAIATMSYKADDIIATLERKLEDLKKKNATNNGTKI